MLFNKKYYEAVTESYIGKTGKLKSAEKELAKVIELINHFNDFNLDRVKMVNASSAAKEYNRLMSEEFGTQILVNFTPVALHVGAGPYTYCNSTPLSSISTYNEYKKTGKIKSHERLFPLFINIDYDTVIKGKLTAPELMGIILHEIGHNISHVPIIKSLDFICTCVFIPIIGSVWGAAEYITQFVYSLPVMSQWAKFSFMLGRVVSDITGDRLSALDMFNKLVLQTGYFVPVIIDPLRHFGGYHAERYSDSLATAYGYGPDTSRALLKIHKQTADSVYNKTIRKNAVLSFGDTMLITFIDIVSMVTLGSVHPKVGHRVKNSLVKLERDLKRGDYPPEVKQQLQNDVNTLKKMYEDYLNATDAEKDASVQVYRKYIERYGLNPLRNIVLDKVYQELEV